LCLLIRDKATNVSFHKFVHYLILSIRLRMIGWAMSQLSTPPPQKKIVQKFLVKIGALSLTIIFGLPCSFWNVSINLMATVLDLNGWESDKKFAYLFSISTITMMKLFPSDFGNPVMKSMETSSQRWLGMANGCKRLGVLIVSTLFCWQTKISTTNLWTSVLSPSQKNSFLTLW